MKQPKDRGHVAESLGLLSEQLSDGWQQAKKVLLPASYKKISGVAICGMGGSHLGADILRHVYTDQLKVPVQIIADYNLPAWVGAQTLVVCSSYSGTTEETLAAMKTATTRKSKVVVISSGGTLAMWAKKNRLPAFIYTPKANPSGQPRLGVGYGLMALLTCWRQLGLVKVSDQEITGAIRQAAASARRYGTLRNEARVMAKVASKKIPILISAEWLAGNLHTWNNQIHENAKSYGAWYLLPDLNHHLLEGLRNKTLAKSMHLIFVQDPSFHSRTIRRFAITEHIVRQQGITVSVIRPQGTTKLAKAIDILSFGGYMSWYMSQERGVEAASIPTVDFLKAQLAKRK